MPLGSKLLHQAVPIVSSEDGEWIEGEKDVDVGDGTPFRCLLQLPTNDPEDNVPRGRRVIVQPQILYEPFDEKGEELTLSAADEVKVTAPEFPDHREPVTYQVEGDPLRMAKPGRMIGYLARLKRVKD